MKSILIYQEVQHVLAGRQFSRAVLDTLYQHLFQMVSSGMFVQQTIMDDRDNVSLLGRR